MNPNGPRMTHYHSIIGSVVSEMILDHQIGKLSQKQKKAVKRPENDKNLPKVAKFIKKGPRKNFIPKQFLIAC